MPNPNLIKVQKPLSLAHFRSVFANSDPSKLAAMAALMPWDYFYRAYEFEEATLNAQWTASRDGGNTATVFAYNAQRNGALRGETGTTNAGTFDLTYASTMFDAADKPFFWARFVAPAVVTNFAFEVGFADPHTASTQGVTSLGAAAAITNLTTPTFEGTYTDIAVVCMDTSYTLTTAALAADSTAGSPAGVALVNRAGTKWTPTAGGIIDVIVGVQVNLSYCWIWDSLAMMGIQQSVAQGPDSGVLLAPYLLFKTRNTTTKQIDLLKAVICCEENRTS